MSLPDIDPSSKTLTIILWAYTLIVGTITHTAQIPTHSITSVDWIDCILDVISKLTPVISTTFLYIINKKAIDAFFKEKFGKKEDS